MCPGYLFESGFVVVGVLRHQRLNGDEHRGDALSWTPRWAGPRPGRDRQRGQTADQGPRGVSYMIIVMLLLIANKQTNKHYCAFIYMHVCVFVCV